MYPCPSEKDASAGWRSSNGGLTNSTGLAFVPPIPAHGGGGVVGTSAGGADGGFVFVCGGSGFAFAPGSGAVGLGVGPAAGFSVVGVVSVSEAVEHATSARAIEAI